jgi:hypothetical protein
LGAADSVKFGGVVTVSCADVLMPSEATVMVEFPAAIPVANPVALMAATAGLLLANVSEPPAMGLPYWSFGAAVNCWVRPTSSDAVCGVSAIEDKEGGAGFVEADVGLPPQLPNKRTISAIDARDDSLQLFRVITKFVALDRTFLQSSSDVGLKTDDKERCLQVVLIQLQNATSRSTGFASSDNESRR